MLFKRKSQPSKLIKRVAVYISSKYQQIIVAPQLQNEAGIIYEQEECTALTIPVEATEIGKLVIDNFDRYSIKDRDLGEHRPSDWPAYRHSRSQSIRAFEQDYIRISVTGANEENIILLIRGLPYENCELTVDASISYHAGKEEIGQRLFSVYEACLTGKIF